MKTQPPSLESLALNTSRWTLLGYTTSQVVRIGSHLILARLLLPETFGLSQLLNVLIQGLLMCFDLGFGTNIIQHKRGEDPVFLQTTWTLEIIRGAILWGATFFLAFPIAYIYEAPEVHWLFPFVGSSLFLRSFTSTNYWMYYRKMQIARITFIEVFGSVSSCLVMIGCAWHWGAVWTLLIGHIVFAIIRSSLSNLVLDGPRMAFRFERETVKEVLHFGKWIFVSTLNTFLTSRIDIVVIGLFLDKSSLGLYGIATRIVNMFILGLKKIGKDLLIPYYSRIKFDNLQQMRARILKIRLIISCGALPIFYSLTIWGQNIVDFLYPKEYQQVGSFLRVLAIGGAIQVVSGTVTPIFIANGDSFRHMLTQISHSLLLIIPMSIAGYYYQETGLIWAIILSHLFNYPVVVLNIKKYGVWLPSLDFIIFTLSALLGFIYLRKGLFFT